jgi:hypothetical protein
MVAKRSSLFCIVLLSCCPLFSQKLELVKTIETTSSRFEYVPDLSKYLPYVAERNSILRLEATDKVVVQQEDSHIWFMDYNRDNGKIVYTFGPADAGKIAIFDTVAQTRIVLGTEISDRTKYFKIAGFGDVRWIDSDSIVFVALGTDFQKRLIKYSLPDKNLALLAQGKDIGGVTVNRTFGIVVYVSATGTVQNNHYLNLSTGRDLVFSQKGYSLVLPLSDRYFLATTYDSKTVFSTFSGGGNIEKIASTDEVNAILDYDEKMNRLVAWTKWSSGTIQFSIYEVSSF